jgi:hypothetical protein
LQVGAPLMEVIDMGCERLTFAADAMNILIRYLLKKLSHEKVGKNRSKNYRNEYLNYSDFNFCEFLKQIFV